MHLHFERVEKPSSYSDCNILTLSWMGKVPDGFLQAQDEEGWKLNKVNYYQDGWLSCGNQRGIVGVTYTSCRCRKTCLNELPLRTNYNLRGHRTEVTLVKWNEPYQKLASCDSSGIIFVWIKYEGRWSIELINDRNTQVTDFSWSHDGRMALICYLDGFVLVGSVSGQRYWSSMLNLDSCTTTCGIWTPDDQQVIFGTSSGNILVIDVGGTMIAQIELREGFEITSMSWSCEKFKMEDVDDEIGSSEPKTYVLAVCFSDGVLYLMKNYDDLFPIIIRTHLKSVKMEWSNKGEVLAVVGHRIKMSENVFPIDGGSPSHSFINIVRFYTDSGILRYTVDLQHNLHPITALTWGHNDKRLFVATGPVLHIGWITKKVASLQLLSRLAVYKSVTEENMVEKLPLPSRLQSFICGLFGKTLRCYLPQFSNLRNFVSHPPSGAIRLHCTMIRHDDDSTSGSGTYVLYLEYLGGLVPILKGKRASKIKPEFVIFDPQSQMNEEQINLKQMNAGGSFYNPFYWNSSSNAGTSESETENDSYSTPSPIMKRKRMHKRIRRSRGDSASSENSNGSANNFTKPESTYIDEMPECKKLILVTSNIWGTKFKILGLVPSLPSHLGSVTYKTSLLHLQPRQMSLRVKELGDPRKNSYTGLNPIVQGDGSNFASSEDEDESAGIILESEAPIAPMTPKKSTRYQGQSSTISPERRPYFRANNTSNCASNHDYINFIPNLNEELLTLQINGDSNGVSQLLSMEMIPASTSYSTSTATIPPVTTNSISTQTSFQSINELINTLVNDKSVQMTSTPTNIKEITTNINEPSTEEVFNQMAKRFAAEFPCSSRTPTTQSFNLNKYEHFQAPVFGNFNNCDLFTQYNSPLGSPNFSPPKGLRYKIKKKDSPRKVSVSYLDYSDGNGPKNCDSQTSIYCSSPKSQRRCGAFNANSGPSSSCSSNWVGGGLSVLACTETRPFSTSVVSHDIKFIDDNENDDSSEGTALQQQFINSPSLLFYRNKSTINHIHTLTSSFNMNTTDFTNIRASVDGSSHYSYSHQRRLTLKGNRPRSLETTDIEIHQLNKEKPQNCMSLDEDDLEEKDDVESVCACIHNNEEKSVKNGSEREFDKISIVSSSNVSRKSDDSNYRNIQEIVTSPVRFQKKIVTNPSREPGSDYIEEIPSPKQMHHRGSLPYSVGSITSLTRKPQSDIKNRSLPASPILGQQRRKAQGRSLFYSPMMLRKVMKQKLTYFDCSSEDDNNSSDEEKKSLNEFRNLESFQKAHIKKKMKVKRRGSRVQDSGSSPSKLHLNCREFVLNNKAPLWNEVSQVYQLDFGGRVTQESAKNFQIEHQGKQVMQFGRIDGNAYTLDFQYPFSALQALAVALANVTQRLK